MAHDLEKKKKRRKPRVGEQGGSGTVFFEGMIDAEEYNPDLQGKAALVVWDKMRRSDSQVKASIIALRLPILQAIWTLDPASDKAKDKEIAAFMEEALFERMEMTWDGFLSQALIHVWDGFMLFEKVFKEEDGQIWYKKLAPRLPKTISKWNVNRNGELVSVEQSVKRGEGNDYIDITIPAEKLLRFTNEQEGDNFEGISMLRSAYKNWFIKSNLEKLDAIKHDRWAVGIPVMMLPQGCDVNSDDYKRAKKIVKNLRAHEQGYALLPFGYELKILEAPQQSGTDIIQSINYHDEAIAKNILTQFITLGSTKSGARSLGEGFQNFFLLGLRAIVDNIISEVNEHVIKGLVDFNFDTKVYPKLTASKIEIGNFAAIADALVKLKSGGILTPDDDLEKHVRSIGNLPTKKGNFLSPSERLNGGKQVNLPNTAPNTADSTKNIPKKVNNIEDNSNK